MVDLPVNGSRGILSTSFHLFLASLSPCSLLLLPYAYSLTGLSFGLPISALLLLLGQWFSPSLLVIEGRYVGARSFHALGGAVFPQSYGLKHAGTLLVLLFQVFVDGGRTLVALLLASQLLVDLSLPTFANGPNFLHSHVFYLLIIGIPTLLSSTALSSTHALTRRPLLPLRWTPFLRLVPQYALPLLWGLIILIFGVSLKNLDDYPSLTKPQHGHLKLQKPSYSSAPLRTPTLWSGVSILFLVLGSSQSSTFPLYRALRKRNALPASSSSAGMARGASATLGLAGNSDHNASSSFGNSMNGDSREQGKNGSGGGTGDGGPSSSTATSRMARHIQSHRFESAALLSCALSACLSLPFGSIGYMSLLRIAPNVFETLPRAHGGFNACRVLLCIAILSNLRQTAGPGILAAQRALAVLLKLLVRSGAGGRKSGSNGPAAGGDPERRRPSAHASKRHKRRSSELELDDDPHSQSRRRADEAGADGASVHSDDEDEEHDDYDAEAAGGFGHYASYYGGPTMAGRKRKNKAATTLLANLGVWTAVIIVACTVKDLGGIAEVVGCIGCAGLGFLIPGN